LPDGAPLTRASAVRGIRLDYRGLHSYSADNQLRIDDCGLTIGD